MRVVLPLVLLTQLVLLSPALADSATSLFLEAGGSFSLKSDSRVLDDRGGVMRVGITYAPLLLMGGITARGARVEASGGDSYALGNIGVFGGLTLFQSSRVRLRLFVPISIGRITPDGGTAWPEDNSVVFVEPEAQLSYRFVERFSVGLGLNHRYIFSYSGKPGQDEYLEKLMFTGSFIYELPF